MHYPPTFTWGTIHGGLGPGVAGDNWSNCFEGDQWHCQYCPRVHTLAPMSGPGGENHVNTSSGTDRRFCTDCSIYSRVRPKRTFIVHELIYIRLYKAGFHTLANHFNRSSGSDQAQFSWHSILLTFNTVYILHTLFQSTTKRTFIIHWTGGLV